MLRLLTKKLPLLGFQVDYKEVAIPLSLLAGISVGFVRAAAGGAHQETMNLAQRLALFGGDAQQLAAEIDDLGRGFYTQLFELARRRVLDEERSKEGPSTSDAVLAPIDSWLASETSDPLFGVARGPDWYRSQKGSEVPLDAVSLREYDHDIADARGSALAAPAAERLLARFDEKIATPEGAQSTRQRLRFDAYVRENYGVLVSGDPVEAIRSAARGVALQERIESATPCSTLRALLEPRHAWWRDSEAPARAREALRDLAWAAIAQRLFSSADEAIADPLSRGSSEAVRGPAKLQMTLSGTLAFELLEGARGSVAQEVQN
jgi:hypothetical protein